MSGPRATEPTRNASRLPAFLLAAVLAVLAWSGVGPRDHGTWVIEVAPALRARLPARPRAFEPA